ncbi:MAG: Uma2 family endonuclease [Catalinimonas sp.]
METTTALSDDELERGNPPLGIVYAFVHTNLICSLAAICDDRFTILPELDLDLPDIEAVPDIAVCDQCVVDLHHDAICRADAPRLTVEIPAPGKPPADLADRARRYLAAGVASCGIMLLSMRAVATCCQPGGYTSFLGAETLRDPTLGIECAAETSLYRLISR